MSQREAEPADLAIPASPLQAWAGALRLDQWVKNLVVLAPLLFSKHLLDPQSVLTALAAVLLFCLSSSGVYLLNDVIDLERDRRHPTKRSRAIASGAIAVSAALIASALLVVASLALGLRLSPPFAGLLALYAALNVAYSLALKHVAIVDVIMIAAFFVLRAVAGGVVIRVDVSSWLIVCTFMVMLFLALGKRYAELVSVPDAATARPSSRGYSVPLLEQLMTITVATTIVSYCLYTLAPEVAEKLGVEHMEATIPFVVYGLFRYLFLVRNGSAAENPARAVIGDRPLLAAGALWGLVVLVLLYL